MGGKSSLSVEPCVLRIRLEMLEPPCLDDEEEGETSRGPAYDTSVLGRKSILGQT